MFSRKDGTGLHPASITEAFQRIAADAGLPPIRLHDLRHTAASLALQAGVPLKVVSEQLGHSSLAITADTYTSVLPVVAHAAAEAVAGLVPRAPRPEPDDDPNSADAAGLSVGYQSGPVEPAERPKTRRPAAKPQVRSGTAGAPSGTRTPNPLMDRTEGAASSGLGQW